MTYYRNHSSKFFHAAAGRAQRSGAPPIDKLSRAVQNVSLLMSLTTDRRLFLAYFSSLGLTSTLFPGVLWGKLTEARISEGSLAEESGAEASATNASEAAKPQLTAAPQLTKDMLRSAAAVAGLEFTDEQLDKMLKGVAENTVKLRDLRKIEIDN